MRIKTLVFSGLLLALSMQTAQAQFAVGVSGGWDYNNPTISKGYATDYSYTGKGGWNAGVIGRYQFVDWFAIRADLRVSTRCYQLNRNYAILGIDKQYTKHRDTYLHLPVMADLSMGGTKLRGHVYLGGYAGYWLAAHRNGETELDINYETTYSFDESVDFDSRRDQRFNAGLIGGLGLSYPVTKRIDVMAECFYMYDLTKSNKTSEYASYPRYNSTFTLNVGVMYNF